MDCCIPFSPLSPHHVSISLFHRYYCYSFGSRECCTRARPVAGPREREMCSLDIRRPGLIDECTIRELHGAKRSRQHDVYHSAPTTVCALTHGVFGSRLSYSLSLRFVSDLPSLSNVTMQLEPGNGTHPKLAAVVDTYKISGILCTPNTNKAPNTVQLLIHGSACV
jgi:hypothetical protein